MGVILSVPMLIVYWNNYSSRSKDATIPYAIVFFAGWKFALPVVRSVFPEWWYSHRWIVNRALFAGCVIAVGTLFMWIVW